MAETVIEGRPNADISVIVVWIPMVASDHEAAARKMSSLFPDARVSQFWDTKRRCGIAYSRRVFPRWAETAFSDASENDASRATMYVHADAPPEQWPAWDIVMFYEKGAAWSDNPPAPVHWACQHAFYGKRQDGTSGLFWRNDFGKGPFASDWLVEVSHGMTGLIGERPVVEGERGNE